MSRWFLRLLCLFVAILLGSASARDKAPEGLYDGYTGFALPLTQPEVKRTDLTAFAPDGRGTVLQPLLGFPASEWDARLDDSTERRHVAAPYHVTLIAKTTRLTGAGVLAALSWAGTDRAESAPWRVVSGATGAWKLTHPKLGDWDLRHWSLPALT